MFEHKQNIGNHNIYNYNISKHKFLEYFQKIYNTESFDKLHLNNNEFNRYDLCDIETSLHEKFYHEIKKNNEFKILYCQLIKDIYEYFFPDEKALIYQSFPSVRFQFINNIAIPQHCDSDDLGKHPLGEKNFILPITKMFSSNRLFIESEPNKKDFQGIDLNYGEIFYFDGNKCVHYNMKNIEKSIRISLDFRVILVKDYMNYILSGNITNTNPRYLNKERIPVKMIIGGYYQIVFKEYDIEKMLDWNFQKDTILQSRPNFDINEANACFDYLKDGTNFITEYTQTENLEKMLCKFIGCKHCIMTTSGNVAIILALMSLDIKEGDEVIVPNYTMIATINSIKLLGATPIITDVDPNTFTISQDIITLAITSKTKAVIHVSLNNRHNNIECISQFCNENNIYLIEDSAQSLGCFVNDKHFGRFGKIGCFSLSTPKIISTGQGGFLITDDDSIANKIRMIKNFGRKFGGIDIFDVFGINFKFTDLQAIIGIEQMKKLPERINYMRTIFDLYYNRLSLLNIMKKPSDDKWIPWFIDIFTNKRDDLSYFLKLHNIQTRPTYPEINKTPMYIDNKTFSISNYISMNGLFLPSHTLLNNKEINYICDLILLFFL